MDQSREDGNNDEQDVLDWRFKCLLEAGWPHDLSVALANLGDVDLHEACALIGKTDASTALRIILPLDVPVPAKYAKRSPFGTLDLEELTRVHIGQEYPVRIRYG